MLINPGDSLAAVFNKLKAEIYCGAEDGSHPFHYGVVASRDKHNGIGLRTLVLRRAVNEFDLYFYTDVRTPKVVQIRADPKLALLFYDPGEKVQIRANGHAVLHYRNELARENRESLAQTGWQSYCSVLTPGVQIQQPEEAFHWHDPQRTDNFAVVEVSLTRLEILQLSQAGHFRAQFNKCGDSWLSTWLVP
jgi:pyridoxamine 5'-phosphate oxidase